MAAVSQANLSEVLHLIHERGSIAFEFNMPRSETTWFSGHSKGSTVDVSKSNIRDLLERAVPAEPEKEKYFYINAEGEKVYVDEAFINCVSDEGQKPCNQFGWSRKGGMVHLETNTLLFPAEDGVSYATFDEVGKQVAMKVCAFVVSN